MKLCMSLKTRSSATRNRIYSFGDFSLLDFGDFSSGFVWLRAVRPLQGFCFCALVLFPKLVSGKKEAHKTNPQDTGRVSLEHPGSTGRCPTKFPVVCFWKTERKGQFLPGHRPGVPGTPGDQAVQGGFQELKVFSLCASSAP